MGKSTTNEEGSVSPTRSPSPDRKSDEEEKGFGSSSEDETTGVTIKNASQYLSYQPKDKKADKNKAVNEERYFKNILRLEPKIEEANRLKNRKN